MSYTLTERQIKILRMLHTQSDFVQGNELAALTDVSVRTIRSDIAELNRMFKENKDDADFHIVSRKTKGYRFEVNDPVRFEQFFIKNSKQKEVMQSDTLRIGEMRIYILLLDHMTIPRLGSLMYLSEFMIRKALRQVAAHLKIHSLSLITNGNEVSIVGKESRIRLMIVNTIYVNPSNELFSENVLPLIKDSFFENTIQDKLIQLMKNQTCFSLSIQAIQYIARFLYISLKRNKMGYSIELDIKDILIISRYDYEMKIAEALSEFIKKRLKAALSRNDTLFLCALIAAFGQPRTLDNLVYTEKSIEYCEKLARRILEITCNEDIATYQDIRMDLLDYLYSFELRLHFNIFRNYMGSSRIKRRRTVSVEIACILARELEQEEGIAFPYQEIILLSVHIGNVFTRARSFTAKSRILVSSQYGLCEAKRFLNSMKSRYGRWISSIEVCETYEIEDRLDQFDLIFVDDKALIEKIALPQMLYYHSYLSITQLDESYKNRLQHEVTNATSFLSRLDPNSFLHIRAFRKTEILHYISAQTPGTAEEIEKIAAQLKKRNEQCSYECGNKAAVIHVHHSCIHEHYFRFIVLHKPILWDRLEVQLILAAYTDDNPINIRYIGGSVNRLIADRENVNLIINKPSLKTIEELLRTF